MDSTKVYAPDEGGHWYDVQGNPHHFRENGKPTTLRDARKEGWFPSVTKVIGDMLPKPALTNWKVNQAILSALTLPRDHREPPEVTASRIVTDMEAEGLKARDVGHATHAMMEAILQDKPTDAFPPEARRFEKAFRDWSSRAISRTYWTERVLVNPTLGVAGTSDGCVDLVPGPSRTIIDLKVRKKADTYKEDIIQLSAYHLSYNQAGLYVASIILDKGNPDNIPYIHHWSPEDIAWGADVFVRLVRLWQLWNDYDPTRHPLVQEAIRAMKESSDLITT